MIEARFPRTTDWVIVALALLLRLGVWGLLGNDLREDRDAYLEIAGNVAQGRGFSKDQPPHPTAYRPPFFPLMVAAIEACSGSPWAVGGLQVFWGVVMVIATLRVGGLLGLGNARLLAGGLVACDPLLLRGTVLSMTEVPCAGLVAMWVWWSLESSQPCQKKVPSCLASLGLGVLFGMLCLCRPVFLGLIPLAVIWQLSRWRSPDLDSTFKRGVLLRSQASLLLGLALLLGPWMIRNALVTGVATPATTHGGYTLYLANNPVFYREVVEQPWGTTWQGDNLHDWQQGLETELRAEGIPVSDEVARDRWLSRKAWAFIRENPVRFLRACLWRGLKFWDVLPRGTDAQGHRFLLFGIAGYYSVWWGLLVIGLARNPKSWRGEWVPLATLVLVVAGTHLVFWTDMRMRAPVAPILALLAARALLVQRS